MDDGRTDVRTFLSSSRTPFVLQVKEEEMAGFVVKGEGKFYIYYCDVSEEEWKKSISL